jgi:hypothetical protein
MSIEAVMPEFAGLSGANWIAVEHAELVVALHAAVTALREDGLYSGCVRGASGARWDSSTSRSITLAVPQPRVSVE